MPIIFTCPVCGRELEAPDAAAGQRGVCKFCGGRLVAPAASGEPARADTPAAAAPPAPPATDPGAWQPPAARGATGWQPPAPAFAYADFGPRVIGFVVDTIGRWLVLFLLSPLLALLNPWPSGNVWDILNSLSARTADPQQVAGQLNLVNLALGQVYWLVWVGLIQWLYFALFESSRLQATPGKLLVGVKVTDMEGRRIGFGRATTRALAKGLSALLCYIGYLMAAFTAQRQALHDIMARTLVLKR